MLTQAEIAAGACLVSDSGSLLVGATSIALDESGIPHVGWAKEKEADFNVLYSVWDGDSWTVPEIITTTNATSNHMLLAPVSSTDVDVYITTSNVRYLNLAFDDYGGQLDLWHRGDTAWSFAETIMSEARSGSSGVNRPFRPYNAHADIQLIFDTWIVSTGIGPGFAWRNGLDLESDDNQTFGHIWAYGDNGFVGNAAHTDGSHRVQTYTDNPTISTGNLELSNARGTTFNIDTTRNRDLQWWAEMRTGDDDGTVWSRQINNELEINAVLDDSGRLGASYQPKFRMTGDFSAQVKFSMPDIRSDNSTMHLFICLFGNAAQTCDGTNGDGVFSGSGYMLRYLYYDTGSAWTETIFRYEQGVAAATVFSGADKLCDDVPNPCWLRVERSGPNVIFGWSTDNSTWSTFSLTSAWDDLPYVSFAVSSNGVGTLDDYQIVISDWWTTGTTETPDFGTLTKGTWATSTYTWATGPYALYALIGVEVDITAAAGSSLFFDLLDTSGSILWTSATLTEDATLALPSSWKEDWSVRMTLAGDGTGSVVVHTLTLTLAQVV